MTKDYEDDPSGSMTLNDEEVFGCRMMVLFFILGTAVIVWLIAEMLR